MKTLKILFSIALFVILPFFCNAQWIDTLVTKVNIDTTPNNIRLVGFRPHQKITTIPIQNLTGLTDTQDIRIYFKCLSSVLAIFKFDTTVSLTSALYPFSVRIITILDSGRNDTSAGIYCHPPLPVYTDTFFIPAEIITGLEVLADKKEFLVIYPNPVSSSQLLHITHADNIKIDSMELYGINGKKHEIKLENSSTLNIQSLPMGLYYLLIHTIYGKIRKKFIIQ